MYINKAIIYGNLTRDPEVRAIPSGQKVASFGVATNRVWKDQNGAKKESVEFHNVVVFGRQAEVVGQYLKKGRPVFIEGRIQTRSWAGQDGQKKYRTEIVADRFQFGPSAGGAQGGQSGNYQKHNDEESKEVKESNPPPVDTIEYPEEDIKPEDIPF